MRSCHESFKLINLMATIGGGDRQFPNFKSDEAKLVSLSVFRLWKIDTFLVKKWRVDSLKKYFRPLDAL